MRSPALSCQVALAVLAAVTALLALAQAAPMMDVDSQEAENLKLQLILSKVLGAGAGMKEVERYYDAPSIDRLSPVEYLSNQKRMRPPMQGRSGGMSLCLWKVCPAAPWLVSRKRQM